MMTNWKMTFVTALVLAVGCGKSNNATNNGSNNANNTNNTVNNANNSNNANNTNNTPNNSNNVSNTTNNETNNPTNNTANNTTNTNNVNNTIVDCGAVTFEGECVSDTALQFCDDDFGLLEYDCTTDFGANATCGDFPDWGADCVVPEGEACEIYDPDLDDYYSVYCSGDDAACVWDDLISGKCQTNFSVATCDPTTLTPSCEGNIFVYDCHIDQPVGADCVALGGLCDGATGCLMSMGDPCDDVVLICSAGLTCNIDVGEALGVCQ